MEKKALLLKLLGFTKAESEAFSAILTLSEAHLSRTWRIVNDEVTKVDFFVLPNRTDSKQLALKENLPAESCLWCSEHPCENQHHILCSDNLTPRISSLTKALNQLADDINTSGQSVGLLKTVVKTNSYLDPEQGILKYLLQPQSAPLLVKLESPTACAEIYLHSAQNVYFCNSDLKQLGAYLSIETELSAVKLSISQIDTITEQSALSAKPISDLIWYAAFHLSQGRLLKGHSNQDIVYLTNWPNLEIPGCQKCVRLAAFMQHNAVSLEVVAKKTAIPIESVYNFYNACYLVGLVEKADKSELHEKHLTTDEKKLLTSIAARIQELHHA